MAKLPEIYTIGNREEITVDRLLVILEDMYQQLATAINKKPDINKRNTNGLTTDTFLSDGDININTNTFNIEMLTSHVNPNTVTWKSI